MKHFLLLISVLALSGCASVDVQSPYMKSFPHAEEGMVRYILHLPERMDESAFEVELIIGKTIRVDTVNKHLLLGEIEALPIPGSAFTRYEVTKLGGMSTAIGVFNAREVERFIQMTSVRYLGPYLVPYNSRQPVVVYVPEGAEVRYRLWSADRKRKGKMKSMKKG